MTGLVDIHNHILPGVDDGAVSYEQALEMARAAVADGIDTIVATPHFRYGRKENDTAEVLAQVPLLQERIDEAGIPLRVVPGGEIPVFGEILDLLREGRVPAMGNSGRWILLEMPFDRLPSGLREVVFRIQALGYQIVVGHPERCAAFHRDPESISRFFPEDVALQITSHSLTGQFGSHARQCALSLLRQGHPVILASDAHDPVGRPPVLSEGREVATRHVGEDYARQMVCDLPRALVEGRDLWLPERREPPKPRRRGLFGLLGSRS